MTSSKKHPRPSQPHRPLSTLFTLELDSFEPPSSPLGALLWRHRMRFETTLGLSVLEPWEKVLYMLIFMIITTLIATAFYKLLPAAARVDVPPYAVLLPRQRAPGLRPRTWQLDRAPRFWRRTCPRRRGQAMISGVFYAPPDMLLRTYSTYEVCVSNVWSCARSRTEASDDAVSVDLSIMYPRI
ncbi:hypothetical protein EWM64_g5934 [Hericium alpestre]|uniref:Uncharacterized protein n=1 Tax=Hericium alpestre TaxID=135208 RepID=A0A4Y9ZVJ1_9AGAM|nr:hypothetical protein EWM64_g5934 [Hericium alpestre]